MKQIVLTDGGMGQELLRRAGGEPTPMWSARVLVDRPDLVRELHADFIRAGARTITINTYSATPERLAANGMGEHFRELQQRGCDLAQEAREECGIEGVRIAGCLPPLVASYRPDAGPEFAASVDLYRRMVAEQEGRVDFLLCETLSSLREIRAATLAASECELLVWLGMTVRDDGSGLLRGGESLEEGVSAALDAGVEAVLINCSKPEAISAVWERFRRAAGETPVGAYANGFTSIEALKPGGTVKNLEARHDLGPKQYADFAMQWANGGAAIVGGCCEVGPQHIAELARRLEEAGYTIGGEIPQQ